tara:strand:+ start:328 stop:648 length:321 start_codon:yes stop_codon:yes gene_type:complete
MWSEAELALLKHLMWLEEPGTVDCCRVQHLFPNHTADEIKQRCSGIRDLARRKERKRLRADLNANATEEPDSPTSVMVLPPAGRLHPALVWVPSTGQEIGPMNLGA